MKGSIYLIGGGEIARGETEVIDKDLKKHAKRNSKFVFLGSAANDAPGYIEAIEKTFNDYFEVIAITKEDGKRAAQNAINSASVIYLGGGQTELLLSLFQDWDLIGSLKKANDNGAIIAGMSAGALALSSFHIETGDDGPKIREGWGLVNACIHVHATGKDANRINEFYQKNKSLDQSFIAIAENSAWIVSEGGSETIGEVWIF